MHEVDRWNLRTSAVPNTYAREQQKLHKEAEVTLTGEKVKK